MRRTIELVVNGVRHTVNADPDRTLLTILRDELDLTGAKYGCGEGQCGACTVIMEGVAVRSCRMPAAASAGRHITTIEGLEENGRLHPLQQAFLETGAMQCGYCTPGMIVSGVALLRKNPNPDDDQIAQAMQGNLCRCGDYPRIVAAVHLAAQKMKRRARPLNRNATNSWRALPTASRSIAGRFSKPWAGASWSCLSTPARRRRSPARDAAEAGPLHKRSAPGFTSIRTEP